MTIKKSNTFIINLKAFSHNIIKYYVEYIALNLPNKLLNLSSQPTTKKKFTILRSPHKYKKAQEHFQLSIFKSVLILKNTNINDIYKILLNKPKGIFIKCKIQQN